MNWVFVRRRKRSSLKCKTCLVDLMHRDKLMQESEGPDADVYKAFQKDMLQEVLLVYFHILKLPNNESLIHVVLEGLAKYGHLLNSHIIMDLLAILKEVLVNVQLPIESILQCIVAALRLIQVRLG